MEDKKKQESMTLKESVMKKSCPISKVPLLFLLALALIALVVMGYLLIGKESKEDDVSFLDSIVISNDTLLDQTDDIEEQLEDLPEDFLDSEVVDTQEIDSSIDEIDEQLENLDTLDSDFSLEESDIGL
ncbi:MAG TPA: hypothetical protein P5059_00295 [Candidatus Dojkabacteria bacterium]|nr:hypothetical protein [Candidatus Dojkabacteria bacterium]